MYGPPPDPRQVLVELTLAEHGLLIALCVALGLALSGLFFVRRLPEPARVLAFVLGQVIALTSPLFLVRTAGSSGPTRPSTRRARCSSTWTACTSG